MTQAMQEDPRVATNVWKSSIPLTLVIAGINTV